MVGVSSVVAPLPPRGREFSMVRKETRYTVACQFRPFPWRNRGGLTLGEQKLHSQENEVVRHEDVLVQFWSVVNGYS